MRPLISVIVPVFNTEKYIEKCIESILNQTYKNIEVLLIDDGSFDMSGSICDEYAKKDNRIIVIHQNNKGVSFARNIGLKLALGKWITFVDSDDWLEKDYFNEMIAISKNYKNIGVIVTNLTRCFDDRKFEPMYKMGDIKIYNKYDALKNIIRSNLFGWEVAATFYEKKCLNKIKFNVSCKYGEDFIFKWLQIRNSNLNILYIPLKGYNYFYRQNSSINLPDNLKNKVLGLTLYENLINNEKELIYKKLLQEKYLNAILGCLRELSNKDENYEIIKKR